MVLELLNLVVVVVGTVEVVVLVLVLVDVDVDVVANVDVDDANEDSTKPLRMLMMNGSSEDTAVVVDVVDVVVEDVVAGELVVNFSLLLCSFLLFRIFIDGETIEG